MIADVLFHLATVGLLVSLCLACNREEIPQMSTAPVSSAMESGPPASEGCVPIEDLNALDDRRPVPLQPMMAWHQKQNMMEHLVAIQRITDGLAREDWTAVAEASALIESSPEMEQMCRHMGAGTEGFSELALDFHRRADAIGAAARAQDVREVLLATSNTLQACTDCHASYRQEVVDAETWGMRTESIHGPDRMIGER
jgi:hypothetical protein